MAADARPEKGAGFAISKSLFLTQLPTLSPGMVSGPSENWAWVARALLASVRTSIYPKLSAQQIAPFLRPGHALFALWRIRGFIGPITRPASDH